MHSLASTRLLGSLKRWLTPRHALGFVSLLLNGLIVSAPTLAETLRIGIEGAYPPFSKVDRQGKIVGFDADISHALCRQLNVKCVIVKQDWEQAIPDLNAGKIDALISSMAITEERMKLVSFTRPYYNSPVRFVVRRDQTISVDPPAQLAGKTVVAEAESIYETFLRTLYAPHGVNVLIVSGGDAVWQALASGKADATVNDVVANADFLKSKLGARFIETGPKFSDPRTLGAGAAIAVAKKNVALATRFDQALMAIYQSGEYSKLRQKYFTFDIWAP